MNCNNSFILRTVFTTVCCLCMGASVLEAVEPPVAPDRVTLEASEITYDEHSGVASAAGSAILTYGDIKLFAAEISMSSDDNIVHAYSDSEEKVTFRTASGEVLHGQRFDYDLNKSEGLLSSASGSTGLPNGRLYITGESVKSAPASVAAEERWTRRHNLRRSTPDSGIACWKNATYTSCKSPHHHYLLKSEKVIIIPGYKTILHHPRVYIGKNKVMVLPFNVTLRAHKNKKDGVVRLRPDYNSNQRFGVKADTTYSWDGGYADVYAGFWRHGGWEYSVHTEQKLADWMTVYLSHSYLYDSDLDEARNRPAWGARFARGGWSLDVDWAEREKRSVVRIPGQKEYETTLWRSPQISLCSPWAGGYFGDFGHFARMRADWGRFQETGSNVSAHTPYLERYGWGIDYFTDFPFHVGNVQFCPFFSVDYRNYGYENEKSDRQEITEGTCGITAAWGPLELGSAYSQRRVSGSSGFRRGWDSYRDNDTLYHRAKLALGTDLSVMVQGIFDCTGDVDNELTSVGYALTYDNHCCARWKLTYNHDHKNHGDNDWYSFAFSIFAFPDAHLEVGDHSLSNPFGRPGGLPAKRGKKAAPSGRSHVKADKNVEVDSIAEAVEFQNEQKAKFDI